MNQNGTNETIGRLKVGTGAESRDLAVELLEAADGNSLPHIVWLGGYRSDMTGTKAVELAGLAARLGTGCIRFDYSGHGASSGDFADGTIGVWAEDALAIVDRAIAGPLIVVGSSMGGWIMLLVALARPERIAGLIGVSLLLFGLIWDTT